MRGPIITALQSSHMNLETLTGSVERVTYYNAENGYSVIRLRPESGGAGARSTKLRGPGVDREGLVTVTGSLPEVTPGENLRLKGRWVNHAKHGRQFQAEFCEQAAPATISAVRRYLGSGLIKGIGPRLAERIVDKFGIDTLEVIETRPEALQSVPDIGPKRSRLIAKAWQEQKQVKEIMLFLHSYGVSTNLAVKIYKQYGDVSLEVVKTDPYRLARDIRGVGFKTADRIARLLGLPPDHPSRIEAGIIYILNEMTGEGHVYVPQQELIARAAEILDVEQELAAPAVERLAQEDLVRLDVLPEPARSQPGEDPRKAGEPQAAYGFPAVYLTPFYHGEAGVADRLHTLASARRLQKPHSRMPAPGLSLPTGQVELSEQQKTAIAVALSNPLSVLTGGPGTGKTTALKALIAALEAAGEGVWSPTEHRRWRYALASPTGRAAKRLSEATGRPASTIHRLLSFAPGEGFKYHAENPLPIDFLVVDEASMLDLLLANHLLKALRPGAHLLLVGDVDQLPSVGAGDVLRDVIASGIAPVTSLDLIFRQAAGSRIITNAHRINKGEMPVFSTGAEAANGGDFFFFPSETPEEAAEWVEKIVCERIPNTFGIQPFDGIQVLAPMYRGPAGVNALNERLQKALNPPDPRKREKSLFGTVFRTGDKVMQIQNNYDKEVYNGDIGLLRSVDLVEHTLEVDFDGRRVEYDWTEADQLVLAYAVSVHKSQGSEFPAVVVPVVTQHYVMLQRNLLYTAITRAKKLCVLVGSKRAIYIAVKNDKVSRRYTALDHRLREFLTERR